MHQLLLNNKALLDKLINKLIEREVLGIYTKNPTNTSAFSDIDIYIVADPQKISDMFNDREKILASVGATLVIWGNKFDNGRLSMNVVYDTYPVPLKIDINMKTKEELKPSFKLKDVEIVYDPLDIIKAVKDESENFRYKSEVDTQELQRSIFSFCGWVFNTFSKIKKEQFELVIYNHIPEYFEKILLKLYFANTDCINEGFYDAKNRIDKNILAKVSELRLKQNENDLVHDMKIIISLYEEIAKFSCEKYALIYPEEAVKRIMNILDKFDEF